MGPGGVPRLPGRISLRLPDWVGDVLPPAGTALEDPEDRMDAVVRLARENVERDGGGPFAAAVFRRGDGELVAAGVNLVVPSRCAVAHAEVVALSLAQRAVGSHDLAAEPPGFELVTSTEPCVMCFGAVHWSGVGRLVCGARGEDARAVGFDEGPKPRDWVSRLEERGVEVVRDVRREEAAAVLRLYRERGGFIYNSRRGG